MSSLKDDASLIMIPSLYKDGRLDTVKPLGNSILHPDAKGNHDGTDGSTPPEGNFTFSRGSNLAATRVDVNGLIEKGRENLLTYSNAFDNSFWVKEQTSVTSNQSGYDGTNDAYSIIEDSSNTLHDLYHQLFNITGLNTMSAYVKYAGRHAQIRVYGIGDGQAFQNFDLQNGVKGTTGGTDVIDSSITSVGNGWYRISMTIIDTGNYSAGVGLITSPTAPERQQYTGNGTSGIFLQDFQLEQGLVATDYIETGASTAQAGILEDMPRLDYSGGASCPSLLLEPSRTNLFKYSEYFNDTYWGKSNASVTDNAIISPEGLQNAYKLIPDNGTGGNRSVGRAFTGLSGVHTFSVFAKAGEYGYVSLRLRNSPSAFVMFNLNDGSIQNININAQYVTGSAKIEDYGNGWYRCSASFDPSGSGAIGDLFISLSVGITGDETFNWDGDGTSGIYIYGAQFEAGRYPTSYIPTYGSSVTRSDDFMNISSLADEIDGNSFTYFLEVNNEAVVRDASTGNISVGATGNRFFLYNSNTTSNRLQLFIQDSGGIEQYVLSADNVKLAIRFEPNKVEVFENGVSVLSTTQNLDFSGNSAYVLRGTTRKIGIKQTAIFPTALTDSECIALTTIA